MREVEALTSLGAAITLTLSRRERGRHTYPCESLVGEDAGGGEPCSSAAHPNPPVKGEEIFHQGRRTVGSG